MKLHKKIFNLILATSAIVCSSSSAFALGDIADLASNVANLNPANVIANTVKQTFDSQKEKAKQQLDHNSELINEAKDDLKKTVDEFSKKLDDKQQEIEEEKNKQEKAQAEAQQNVNKSL